MSAVKSVTSGRQARSQAAPPCRILIISQVTEGGVAACLRDVVEVAVSAGYEVTVACPSTCDLAAWAVQRGGRWERLEMRRSPHPSDVMAVARIRRLARSSDLVHLHSSKAGAVGRLALASLGRQRPPSVFTPHAWSWLVGGRLSPAYRIFERIMLSVTSAVVAVSEEEKAEALAVLGARAARIEVNLNGVDVGRFCPQGPVTGRPAEPLLVCVGRLCRQRAPDVAVAALAQMQTPGVRLRLVGDGEDRPALEAQIGALGLTGRVELVGFRPDPAPDLRAADVVVIPSRYDGMALVLLEAMACGAAITATRVAGSSVLEGAGQLIPAEDPASLARAADALLADPGRRRRLRRAARRAAVDKCRLQLSLEGTLRLWQRLGACPGLRSSVRGPPCVRLGGQGGCIELERVSPRDDTRARSQDPLASQAGLPDCRCGGRGRRHGRAAYQAQGLPVDVVSSPAPGLG